MLFGRGISVVLLHNLQLRDSPSSYLPGPRTALMSANLFAKVTEVDPVVLRNSFMLWGRQQAPEGIQSGWTRRSQEEAICEGPPHQEAADQIGL